MKKIVIVDDDPCMRELVTELLKPRYKVLSAEDGLAGLEMVKKEAPDLVVLDVLMPRMHGFEVCKRIRQDENLKDIKVLILSSKSYPHDIKTASEAGADIFVVKPFEIDNFLEEIAALLNGEKKPVKLQFLVTRGTLPAPNCASAISYSSSTPAPGCGTWATPCSRNIKTSPSKAISSSAILIGIISRASRFSCPSTRKKTNSRFTARMARP